VTPELYVIDSNSSNAAAIGGGESKMAGLIISHDWSGSLGAVENWPQSLKTTVGILVHSPIPIVLLWGPDGIMIYNDAYAEFAGRRHPSLLGAKVVEGWPEVADFNANIMKVVMAGGTLTYRDHELLLDRRGRLEPYWFDLGYSPVIAEDGKPGGVIAIVVETTDRVLARRSSATERDRLAQMFQQAPSFMALLEGKDHVFRLANPGYDRLTGGREVLGKSVAEALPEVVDQGFVKLLDEVYATGKSYSALGAKVALQDISGRLSDRYLDFVYQPLTAGAGGTSAIFVQGVDVTERSLAEQALRISDGRFRFLDDLNRAIGDAGSADEILDITNRMTGEFMHVSICAYADMDQDEDGFTIRGDWSAPGSPSIVGSYKLADFGKLAVRTLSRGAPLVIKNNLKEIAAEEAATFQAIGISATICMPLVRSGKLTALMAIHDKNPRLWTQDEQALIREVTERSWAHIERVAAQAEIKNSEENLRVLASALPNQMWTAKADGMLDWFNATVYTYSGASPGDLDGDKWASIVHPDDLPLAADRWSKALASGHVYETEFRLRRHDGVYRWHIARAVPITGSGKAARWIGTNTDVQDLKETQAALADLNSTLEQRVEERTKQLMEVEEALRQAQKMEAVGQLTGGIAHDFNNILGVIGGSFSLIERRLSDGKPGLEKYISAGQESVKRAASLTQRLLAFSRRQTLDAKALDVNRLIGGLEDLIRRTVGPSVQVEVVGAAGLWATKADQPQLESALLNLCINARDAMMPDGGKLTIETANKWLDDRAARERELSPGQYVSLCVSDTGTGMPPDVIARAFDPFFTTKPIGQGTGLGLSMVYGFVRQSGGQVRIYSEIGQGSTICLYFPRFAGLAEAAEEQYEPTGVERGSGETIVVIDDEPSLRMMVTDVLTEADYHVLQAGTGAEGLRILQREPRVDLLITDVGLPGGMNGRQVAEAARKLQPDLKVLFITGYAENAAIGNGLLGPGMDVAAKPFVVTEFAAKVRDILDR
jgi:PAS domain S-box-containing protein